MRNGSGQHDAQQTLQGLPLASYRSPRASEHARTYGGKPWRYALIPHDAIAENMTLAFLLKQ